MQPSSSLLSDKQRSELNKSILAYLACHSVPQSSLLDISKFLNQNDLGDDNNQHEVPNIISNGDQATKDAMVLEKKWTTVVRLQRKVLDLELEVQSLKSELESGPGSLSRQKNDPVNWLPHAPSKHTLTGHRQLVTSIAFHPLFSLLASCSEDGTIKIWDWELGELERTIKAHTKAVLDIDFGLMTGNLNLNGTTSTATMPTTPSTPTNTVLLASCSSDLTIKIWDPSSDYDNIRALTGHDHTISTVRFVPSGTHLISASRDKSIRIWEVKSGYCIRTILGHSEWVRCAIPSLDGQYILSCSIDQSARISSFTTGQGKLSFIGHEHVVETVAFAPPSAYPYLNELFGVKPGASPPPSPYAQSFQYLATGSRDKTIKLWTCRGELVTTLGGHDNWVRGLVFHPGGKYLLSVSDDKTIRCWDLSQSGRCVKIIRDAHSHFITSIRWVPSVGDKLACVIATGSVDTSVKVWG